MYEIKGSTVGDSWSDIVVYFNGNTAAKAVTLPGGTWNIAVNGAVTSTNSIGTASGQFMNCPYKRLLNYPHCHPELDSGSLQNEIPAQRPE